VDNDANAFGAELGTALEAMSASAGASSLGWCNARALDTDELDSAESDKDVSGAAQLDADVADAAVVNAGTVSAAMD